MTPCDAYRPVGRPGTAVQVVPPLVLTYIEDLPVLEVL
jgi:hypothetical protein